MDVGDLESPDEVQNDMKNRWQAVIGLFGLFLLAIGLIGWFGAGNQGSKIDMVQIQSDISEDKGEGELVVDVSGAVKNPGVYRMRTNSRVGEAISMAGGLLDQADQGWVQQKLNLAQVLSDGVKIYIPYVSEVDVNKNNDLQGGTLGSVGALINVNNASLEELDGLWGVGESRAQSIIDNRPYQNVEELISKAGLPSNVFEQIKEKITVF